MDKLKNFGRRVLSVLICFKYKDFNEDNYGTSLLPKQKNKLGAHEIEVRIENLFELVLTRAEEILDNMQVKDGSPENLEAAKNWFQTKVTAVKGIWWPDVFGVQYELYSQAVRMSSYFLDIIDEKSRDNILEWQKLSKDVTLLHIDYCLLIQKKRRSKVAVLTSWFSRLSFEKAVSRVDKRFFQGMYLDYEFFSEERHVRKS